MKARVILSVFAAIMVVASTNRHADAAGATGLITAVVIDNGAQFAAVAVTGAVGSRAACHNGPADQWGFDISTAKGKALLSLIEGAQLAGKRVGVGTDSNCVTVQPGLSLENLSIITVFTN